MCLVTGITAKPSWSRHPRPSLLQSFRTFLLLLDFSRPTQSNGPLTTLSSVSLWVVEVSWVSSVPPNDPQTYYRYSLSITTTPNHPHLDTDCSGSRILRRTSSGVCCIYRPSFIPESRGTCKKVPGVSVIIRVGTVVLSLHPPTRNGGVRVDRVFFVSTKLKRGWVDLCTCPSSRFTRGPSPFS